MDWERAIERNGEALKRILALLVAMAGLASHLPLVGRSTRSVGWGSSRHGHPHPAVQGPPTSPQGGGESGFGPDWRLTLPRRLHRAIVRLLRPAEAAARRLIIVIARDLVVPVRPAKPDPALALAETHAAMRRLGLAVVVPTEAVGRLGRRAPAARPRTLSLPLLDPLPNPFRRKARSVPGRAVPRIWTLGMAIPAPFPPPPSPDDPVDATRVALRLAALARALDDLPRQALRFARWKAGRDAAAAQAPQPPSRRRSRFCRVSPLRPGPAWGMRRPGSRRPPHEVDEVLANLHYFAFHALKRRDTS